MPLQTAMLTPFHSGDGMARLFTAIVAAITFTAMPAAAQTSAAQLSPQFDAIDRQFEASAYRT